MSRAREEIRYEKLTWPEINDAIEQNQVCIVPCGAVEQHGPHLPLDVDVVCPSGIAQGAARLIADKALVLPTLCYGYTGHVMDFPGTINTHYTHFIDQVLDVVRAELRTVATGGITPDELLRGKGQLRGGLVLGLEDPASRMSRLGKAELVHDTLMTIDQVLDRIAAVTPDECAAVAEIFARPEILAVVGP